MSLAVAVQRLVVATARMDLIVVTVRMGSEQRCY